MKKEKKNDTIQRIDARKTNGRRIIYLFIVLLFISISSIILFNPFEQQIDTEKEPDFIPPFDDTICPEGTQQGISIEIQRIHKKGIEELIRKPSRQWTSEPIYHFVVVLNDAEWIGHSITTWDTGYVGWQVHRFVTNQTDEVPVTIRIFESKKTFLRTVETEIEHIELTYDFRSGRWTGDNHFDHPDGYGHYNGENYEIWFDLYQIDNDNDGIPYWTEVNLLKTDPYLDDSPLDQDDDGIPTVWEWKWGYDPFTWDDHKNLDPDDDGLSNSEEYTLEKWGANPFHKEIYIEVDFMEAGPSPFAKEHIFWKESQCILMDVFSRHDITVHIDDGWPDGPINGGGQYLSYVEEYIGPFSGRASEYYKHYFSDDRKGSFRYIFVHHSGGWNFPQTHKLWADVISIPSNNHFFRTVFFPPAFTPRLQRLAMAVSVIHELGHSLNLNPSYCQGIDNSSQVGRNDLPPLAKLQARIDSREYWNTYESVMNYQKFGVYVSDYSDGSHGIRDSDDWGQIDLTFFQRTFDEDYDIGYTD